MYIFATTLYNNSKVLIIGRHAHINWRID
jgi:hypothetical protein